MGKALHMAMVQNQIHFGIGEFTTHFSGDWDVHWGYRLLTHGHIGHRSQRSTPQTPVCGVSDGCVGSSIESPGTQHIFTDLLQ